MSWLVPVLIIEGLIPAFMRELLDIVCARYYYTGFAHGVIATIAAGMVLYAVKLVTDKTQTSAVRLSACAAIIAVALFVWEKTSKQPPVKVRSETVNNVQRWGEVK